MPRCPECGEEKAVLIACQLCPLVCCYACACALDPHDGKIAHPCERLGDRWPEEPSGEKDKEKKRGEIGPRGRLTPVNPRNPTLNSTNISPGGHLWSPA